jgi:hypothetical protein
MKVKFTPMKRHIFLFLCTLFIGFMTGCFFDPTIPDQSAYKPLSTLTVSNEAVARVYAAAPPFFGPSVLHTWFVVKSADSDHFDRWEVWVDVHEHISVIYKNKTLYEPEEDFGLGCYVVAEQVGSEAERIIKVLEESFENYPYQSVYHYLPGPNCNTYTQWVLDQAAWNITLPDAALGKDYGQSDQNSKE